MSTWAGIAEIQVVVPAPVQEPLKQWLASRGLYLFPIPVEDDLPTYGIGIRQKHDPDPKENA